VVALNKIGGVGWQLCVLGGARGSCQRTALHLCARSASAHGMPASLFPARSTTRLARKLSPSPTCKPAWPCKTCLPGCLPARPLARPPACLPADQFPPEKRERYCRKAQKLVAQTLQATRFAGCPVVPVAARPGGCRRGLVCTLC
jgi:hypothetical protein